MPIVEIYKPIGKTPLEIVNKYKEENNINRVSYAGRLDPMAHGLLILLTNEDCGRQNTHHNYDKTYNFKVLLGVSTDTYDTLGIIKDQTICNLDIEEQKNKITNYFQGTIKQYYPPYSSVRVRSSPLWYYAKHNLLNTIEIPYKNINIKDFKYLNYEELTGEEIKREILPIIKNVKGNFRQEEIIDTWDKFVDNDKKFTILEFKADVSCGTYIRSFCHEIGKILNCSACAYEIYRTKVGNYIL